MLPARNFGWRLCVFLCLFAMLASTAQAQSLGQLRSEVRVKDPAPPREPDRSQDNQHDDDDDCDDSDSYESDTIKFIGLLSAVAITAPVWVPMKFADDELSRPGYFPAFPYQYDVGYMLIPPNVYEGNTGTRDPFTYAVRARSDYGTNFTGLNWVGGQVLAEFSTRFGLESDFRFYQQDFFNPPQNAAHDTAWLGDANVFYRFAQNEFMQFRTGLGVNWLSDRLHTDVGFNFTYAADFYSTKPWVISGEFDWGRLGDETLLHARITTGVQVKGLEAYVGYDLIDVGKFQSNSLIAGVRLWF
ncbi:hypothetical protein [Anatilimnocola floriformis]|uniref:hypothetical protein n=1 Tax=Anatilimnocola floriformis TaxID=2948575 RepID=UPI0020C2ADD4|nr:hypothetical protein [Anatilimnocola floriformis]